MGPALVQATRGALIVTAEVLHGLLDASPPISAQEGLRAMEKKKVLVARAREKPWVVSGLALLQAHHCTVRLLVCCDQRPLPALFYDKSSADPHDHSLAIIGPRRKFFFDEEVGRGMSSFLPGCQAL